MSLKEILTHIGVIDPAFSDNLKVILTNLTNKWIKLDRLIAITQITIKICSPSLLQLHTLRTNRKGFGSSNNGTLYEPK